MLDISRHAYIIEHAFSLSCVRLGRDQSCLEILELFPLRATRVLLRGHRGALVAREQMYAVELVR